MRLQIDIDLMRTFAAIAEGKSFAAAADDVGRTQPAVSMQMKRLEAMIGRPLFHREGRQNRLTLDGERLLDYAQRILQLHDEAANSFAQPEMTGLIRLGTPDEYAEQFLPQTLASFARTHPLVQVEVECLDSTVLIERVKRREIDLSVITCPPGFDKAEVVRREPLLWVTSARHNAHRQDPLPLAVSDRGCLWRDCAVTALKSLNRPYRMAYTSSNWTALSAAVLAGLAVGALPEMVMRPGMRILKPSEGFPALVDFDIGIICAPGKRTSASKALSRHISESLACVGRPAAVTAA